MLILIGGYAIAFRPLQASIADHYVELDELRSTIERNVAFAKQIAPLEHERAERAAGLDRIHVRDSRAGLVDRFLRTLAATTTRDGVFVESVLTATSPANAPNSRSATAAPPLLEELPLDITLRGHYGDVLRAIRDLDSGNFAASIGVIGLRSAGRSLLSRPELDAAIHVILLREADATTIQTPRSG
jgi:hypothetical protein